MHMPICAQLCEISIAVAVWFFLDLCDFSNDYCVLAIGTLPMATFCVSAI